MTAKVQIIVLLFSYLYGIMFYILSHLNNLFIHKKNKIYRSITSIVFIYNIVLIYIIAIFKINNGSFHIYFLIMIILGFISGIKTKNKMLKNVKLRSFIEKIKSKCYTKNNKRRM